MRVAEPFPRDNHKGRVKPLCLAPGELLRCGMDSMRPRGVALFEGQLVGDTLTGQMRFGGVNLESPLPPLPWAAAGEGTTSRAFS